MWLTLFCKPLNNEVNEDITVTVIAETKLLLHASITEIIDIFLSE